MRTSCVKAWRTSALHWKPSCWWKKLTTLFQCEIHSMDDVRGFWYFFIWNCPQNTSNVIVSFSCKAYSGTNEFAAKIVEGCPCSHEVDPYWKYAKQTGPGFGTDHIFVDRDPVLFTMVAQYMRQNDPFAMFKTEGRPFERELRYFGITLRVVLYLQSTFFLEFTQKGWVACPVCVLCLGKEGGRSSLLNYKTKRTQCPHVLLHANMTPVMARCWKPTSFSQAFFPPQCCSRHVLLGTTLPLLVKWPPPWCLGPKQVLVTPRCQVHHQGRRKTACCEQCEGHLQMHLFRSPSLC